MKKTVMLLFIAGCLLAAVSLAQADLAGMNSAVAEYKAASQDLIQLYNGIRTEAEDKSAAAREEALVQKQKAAEAKFTEAMQKLDPNNPEDGKAVEKAFGEIQKANEAVGDAHERMMQREAAAKAPKK